MSQNSHSPTTRAVRAAIATDREHGAVAPPIHLTSTFAFEGFGVSRKFDYTRSGNPTRTQLADALAGLENGAGAVVTSTGMSAVTLAVQLLKPSDTLVAAHDCYGGTQRLFKALAGRGQFDLRLVDLTAADAPAAIAALRPAMVWIETPSNPLLRITDVRAVAAAARAVGAIVVVDNTFLSPALQQPIALGADLVVHSTTKYLNGHSDVVGGAVIAADKARNEELTWWANCLGITGAPFDSYLTLRGVRTLHSRIRDHLASADAVVEALVGHPAVTRVYYPGLTDHPGHEIARAQQSGFGAMVSFEVVGGIDGVRRFVESLRCFTLAESLGGVESLAAHPATMTHASMTSDARATAGISDSLVRLSCGIESPEDLASDVTAALDAVLESAPAASASRRTGRVQARRTRDHVDVVLVGAGAIGRELIAQVTADTATPLRIAAVCDRSGFVFDPAGLGFARLAELNAHKAAGRPLSDAAGGQRATALELVQAAAVLGRPVLVDATPADTTELLETALAGNFDVVLANKVPLAAEQVSVDRLNAVAERHGRTILHEATVGAGLPVIDTLRKLQEAGDEIQSIAGCPSGTLGYLFGELGRATRFSDALHRAVELGYTEPDPRIDLSGLDVARKALILARAIGFRGELSDVHVESLVPPTFADTTPGEFLARASELDDSWDRRVNDARRAGRVLRYRALVTPTAIVVGLVPVRLTDSLGTLHGTDNQFTFITRRYNERPLVITGPGAGPAVTAAGVFNDLLRLQRTAPRPTSYARLSAATPRATQSFRASPARP
ncbi:MAG TPA: cystathionine gamma-synthase [Gemmatimonadaceae bacterium]|nr:cystathionine gamma-synthase [Gemmatimonadaceae bacterium]